MAISRLQHAESSIPGRIGRGDDSLPYVSCAARLRGRGLPNAMTIDVEDYFQVSAFESRIDRKDWDRIEPRLPRNIDRILEILDDQGIKATFFTLGWVCERFPAVIRRIAQEGHEIASHGSDHTRIGDLTRQAFLDDVSATRKRLQDTTGSEVLGYRAPSFSLGQSTLWAYEMLERAGYTYSSSIFPISHDHYGLPSAPRFPFIEQSSGIMEIPMSTTRLFGRNLPCSGGGYFRLLPLAYSRWAVRRINEADGMPAMFYFHPWEIDPGQPRVRNLPVRTRFRHYLNLGRFERRWRQMLAAFEWDRVDRIFMDRT